MSTPDDVVERSDPDPSRRFAAAFTDDVPQPGGPSRFFPYEVNRLTARALRPIGFRPDRDGIWIVDGRMFASFGFLHLSTSLSNVAAARRTGPYRWYRALGARLSLADRGLTFGTTPHHGVCIEFHDPVRRVLGPWDHTGLTVTVDEPDSLIRALLAPRPDAVTSPGAEAP